MIGQRYLPPAATLTREPESTKILNNKDISIDKFETAAGENHGDKK